MRLPSLIHSYELADALELATQTSLWGNKMDLSLWPAASSSSSTKSGASADVSEAGKISFGSTLAAGRKYILDDQTASVVKLLESIKSTSDTIREIGIVVDNAGYELFSDLLLGHCLLALGVATKITFHTKAHPTFVSDATNEDCMGTINFLMSSDSADTSSLASTMNDYILQGKFVFEEDLFWCQPTAFWDMPNSIQQKIQSSKLVFVKGDANYRRLLGEREWPLDTSATDVLSYWPVPVCALRTFKGEIGCGITKSKQKEAADADLKWLVSGKWGVVQLGGV